MRITVRLYKLGVGGTLLDDVLLWSNGGVVVLKGNSLIELVETCVIGIDGEGFVKALVHNGGRLERY